MPKKLWCKCDYTDIMSLLTKIRSLSSQKESLKNEQSYMVIISRGACIFFKGQIEIYVWQHFICWEFKLLCIFDNNKAAFLKTSSISLILFWFKQNKDHSPTLEKVWQTGCFYQHKKHFQLCIFFSVFQYTDILSWTFNCIYLSQFELQNRKP